MQIRLTNAIGVNTAEDNMNVQLKDITVTARDGRVSHLDQVYIRGSHVRFFIVPDMLRFVNCMVALKETFGAISKLGWERKYLTNIGTGTRLCSARGGREVAVLVWREEELRSTGREAKGVQGVDEESIERESE